MQPVTRFATFPQAIPVLQDGSVLLRAVTEGDISAWYARATDAESADLAGDAVPDSIDKGVAWLQSTRDRFDKQVGIRWAIVPHGEDLSVGTVGLAAKAKAVATAELGVVIARAKWSKGIGTAAVRLVLAYGFEELALREIQAQVLQRNPASIRLLEKAGFFKCGVIPPTATEPEELLLYSLVVHRKMRP
jgi:[ribosomal protein S5]-alanine N-acetyltransferase